MADLGDMVVRIVGDTTQLDSALTKSEQQTAKYGKSLSLFVTAPLLAMGVAAVKSAAQMEMLEASFSTMLGSAEKASMLMADLKKMAAVTPFETTDLAQASKTLLQFGIAGEKIIPTLSMLGDASGGNSAKMSSMALVFGQVSSMGKLMGQDLLQLINAGFNPLQEIARTTGKSMAYLKDEMSKGRISADMVADAFKTATSAGGKFYKGMDTASKTLEGLLSTLADDTGALARSFVDDLMPAIKNTVKEISKILQSITALDKGTKENILIVGAFAAALGPVLMAVNAAQKAILALNAGMALNPAVAVTVAIVALAAGMAVLVNNIKNAQKEQEQLNKVMSGGTTGKLENDYALVQKRIETINALIGSSTGLIEGENDELEAELALLYASRDKLAEKNRLQVMNLLEQEDMNTALTVETLSQEEITKALEARARIEDKYKSARSDVLGILEDEKTEYQKIADTIAKLEASPWAKGKLEDDRLKAIEVLRARQATIIEEEIAATQKTEDEKAKIRADAYGDWIISNAAALDEINENLDKSTINWDAYFSNITDLAFGLVSSLQDLMQQATANELAEIDQRLQAELEAAGLAEDTTLESLQKQLDAAILAGDTERAAELANEIEKETIKEKYAKMAAEVEYKNALAQWKVNLAMAVASGARAVIETFKNSGGWPWGVIPAGIMGGISAAQVSLINKSKPSLALAEGGIIMPTPGGTDVTAAEAGQPEVFFPLDKLEQFISKMPSGNLGTANSDMINLVVQIDSMPILKKIFPATKNKQVLISQGAVI